MSYKTEGVIVEIADTAQITEKFKKRDFVIEIQSGMYPQQIKFQIIQDKVVILDSFAEGEPVTVHFNLKGRAYEKNGKTMYFTNLEAWKIESNAEPQAVKDSNTGEGDFPF